MQGTDSADVDTIKNQISPLSKTSNGISILLAKLQTLAPKLRSEINWLDCQFAYVHFKMIDDTAIQHKPVLLTQIIIYTSTSEFLYNTFIIP